MIADVADCAPRFDGTVDQLLQHCPEEIALARLEEWIAVGFRDDRTGPTLVCRASDGSRDLTMAAKTTYQTIIVADLLEFSKPLPWTDLSLGDWLYGRRQSDRSGVGRLLV